MSGIVEFDFNGTSPSIVPINRSVSVAIGKPQTRPQESFTIHRRILEIVVVHHHPHQCPVLSPTTPSALILSQGPANFVLAKNQPKRITSIWFSPPPPKSTFYLASIGAIWFLINPSQFRNIRWLHSTTNNSRMMMTKIIVISVSSSVRLSLLRWNGWNIIGGGIRLFFCSFSDLLPLLSVLRWYIKRNLNLVRGSTSSGRIMKWMRWDGMGRGNIEHL